MVEAGVLVGLGYWGFQTGSSTVSRWVLAIGVPSVAFGIWGAIDFHQADRWAERLRLVEELAISGLAALAVFSAGQPALGLALGVATLAHHTLVYVLGDRLLKTHDDRPARLLETAHVTEADLEIDTSVQYEPSGLVATITCRGAIGKPSRKVLQTGVRRLLDSGVEVVRFDLREAWIDSRGTALVLELYDECLTAGRGVEALTAPTNREVFSRLGLPLRFRFDGGHLVRVIPPGDGASQSSPGARQR